MKRPIRSLHGLGLTTALCLVFVLSTLLANSAIEPSVAHAQGYVVDISLGDNPVPSGTGTSVKVSIHDDFIFDTYSSSATAFSLHAWVYRSDSWLTNTPSCHGSGWPNSRSITPVSDGNRMVITFRISGSCPLWEESRYSVRADVIARIDGIDTVVANRAIDFTVEGVPPTATPTATEAPGNTVVNPPVRPTQSPTSRPTPIPTSTPTFTPTPTRVQDTTGSGSTLPPPEPLSLPTSVLEVPLEAVLVITSLAPTSIPRVGTSVPETVTPVPPPPTTCIVAHAATPVQVCRDNDSGALHFHFVGRNDVFSGPMFPSVAELISDYPPGHMPSEVELYNGTSTGTGKRVLVRFLTDNGRLHISTFYADTTYAANKPYIFTIDQYGTVTHLAW